MSPEALGALIASVITQLVAAHKTGSLTESDIPAADKVAVMRPKDRAHGDWATNIALQLAKKAGLKPRDLAQPLAELLQASEGIASVEVAGPGFINIVLDTSSAAQVVQSILDQQQQFGTSTAFTGETLNLEFVSANPTGPIHIGGTRWAAIGDSMARILAPMAQRSSVNTTSTTMASRLTALPSRSLPLPMANRRRPMDTRAHISVKLRHGSSLSHMRRALTLWLCHVSETIRATKATASSVRNSASAQCP